VNYLEFYELTQEPFSNAPVSRFYYSSAQHAQALMRLTHAVSGMKGLAVLVGDIGAGKTYRYDIAPDGGLAGKTLAAEQGSDGMTLDSEGNLYLTGDGVVVFDRIGRQIDHIQVPDEQWTANVSFGGKDRQTLFITASTGLYAVRMRVTGANAAK